VVAASHVILSLKAMVFLFGIIEPPKNTFSESYFSFGFNKAGSV
jgi:hypothetical protein